MPRGGYQKPANPAPVSGPGALSRRTDGQAAQYVPDLPYGEGEALMRTQRAATMAGSAPTPTMSAPPSPVGHQALPSAVPLTSPTQYPDEPVTAGVPEGSGPGPEVMASAGATAAGPTRDKLLASLPVLTRLANTPNASPELRALVRYLRSSV